MEDTGILHAEQTFDYSRLPQPDEELVANARVARVRELRGNHLVQITENVTDARGGEVIEATSLLVIAPKKDFAQSVKGSGNTKSSENSRRVSAESRGCAGLGELIRYAGASRDFNPIHWDADYAAGLGLPGPIVHGMLIYNWAFWTLAEMIDPPPAFKSRIRFVSPLLAGAEAVIRIFDDFSFEVTRNDSSPRILIAKGSFDLSRN